MYIYNNTILQFYLLKVCKWRFSTKVLYTEDMIFPVNATNSNTPITISTLVDSGCVDWTSEIDAMDVSKSDTLLRASGCMILNINLTSGIKFSFRNNCYSDNELVLQFLESWYYSRGGTRCMGS